jgi:mRNA-degrading endonuclease RelE of RelBE toxin-antitoxin system
MDKDFAESTERELARLPAKVRIKALEKIQLLQADPTRRGVKKLAGNDYYSIRFFGDHYRIVLRLFPEDHLVLITRVRHRSDAYRGL